ncbi:MAG: RlmE family RNA methyltransferase [Alphaproteobacteria bacterium]
MTSSRELKTRVKTARKRTTSSTRWLQRQLNDPYVREAKRAGYRSRAAFKLVEIDDRYGLLKPGMCIVDLGAAPGGWCQVAASRVKSPPEAPAVVAIDLNPFDPVPGVEILEMDFMDAGAPGALVAALTGRGVDVVLSDMAAPSTGHRGTDHLRIMGLLETAVEFSTQVLRPGGAFLGKVLQGGTEAELLTQLKHAFSTVRHVKPKASRADSAELYVLATGRKG